MSRSAANVLENVQEFMKPEEIKRKFSRITVGLTGKMKNLTKKLTIQPPALEDPEESITDGRAVLVRALDSPVVTNVQSVPWPYVKFLSNKFRDPIARGGFGTIYRGIDMDANARVVIKVLRSDCMSDDDKKVFEREILCLSELSHPNVVRLLAKSSAKDDRICMILKYAGVSVASILSSRSSCARFTPTIRLYVFECLVSAIEYLHSKDIFHRDIKPENMCLRDGWELSPHMVLVDFGIAKCIPDKLASETLTSNPGTEAFMAPEYADNKNPRFNEKSEVYSVGMVMTCLTTGGYSQLGEAKGCLDDFAYNHRDRSGGEWYDDVVRSLSDLISRCNSIHPFQRPDVQELLAKIKDLRSQNGQLSRLSPEAARWIQPHHSHYQKKRNGTQQCVQCDHARTNGITCQSSHFICTESSCLEELVRTQIGSQKFHCPGPDCQNYFTFADLYGLINFDLFYELLKAQEKELKLTSIVTAISKQLDSLQLAVCSHVTTEVRKIEQEIIVAMTSLVISVHHENTISHEFIKDSIKGLKAHAEKLEKDESRLEVELKELRKQQMRGVGNQEGIQQKLDDTLTKLENLSLQTAKGVALLASGRLQCPRLFILWPVNGPRWLDVKRAIYKEYRLFFLCAYDNSLIETSVTIKHVRPWLRRVAPVLKFAYLSVRVLAAVYAIPIPSLPDYIPGSDVLEQFKEVVDHTEKLLLDVDNDLLKNLKDTLEQCTKVANGDEMHELISKVEGEISEEAYAALASVAYEPKNRGWMDKMDIACYRGSEYAWVDKANKDAFEQGHHLTQNQRKVKIPDLEYEV